MKYITLTFDDGRKDNIEFAAPILKKYGVPAVLFCTTGFIDGTWEKPADSWKSVKSALTIKDLVELKHQGWEIGLHGDKHITEYEDWKTSIEKLTAWGLRSGKVAFSIPNSFNAEQEIQKIQSSDIGKEISYIRGGRGISTGSLKSKFLYAAYSILKMQKAYNTFNYPSVNRLNRLNRYDVKSVVVKRADDPRMLLRFISAIPDNTWLVLMFHSILPLDDELYKVDDWTWSEGNFDSFVNGLSELQKATAIQVVRLDVHERKEYE